MVELISKQQAQVLTSKGFFHIWRNKRDKGMTRERAYNETEALHRYADLKGENKYSDFSSFDRWARKQEASSTGKCGR